MTDTTPYEEIDPEIRRLVRLMNAFPGIRTTFSCAGHKPHDEAYVEFHADSLETLRELMAVLPYYGRHTIYRYESWETRTVWIDLRLTPSGELVFSLRIDGNPPHKRDSAISDVEAALAARTDPQRRLSPTHGQRTP